MALAGSAARGGLASVGGQLAKFLIQFGSIAILARLLVPGDFGILAMVLAVAGVAGLISDFGLSMASVQRVDITSQERSNLFWASSMLGLAAGGVVFGGAGLIAEAYANPVLTAVAQLIALTFVLQGVGAQFRAELIRSLRYGTIAAIDIAAAAAGALSAVLLATGGAGYWALVWQQIVVSAVSALLLFAMARWVPSLPRRQGRMRELFGFGANTGAVQLLTYLSANVDSILIGRFVGAAALGVYNQSYQFFKVPLQQLAAPLTMVSMPLLSRIKGDADLFQRYVIRLQLVLVYVLGGAFCFLTSVATPLFAIYLGPGWDEVPVVFTILAVGGVFQAAGYVYYWVFLAKDLTGFQLKFTLATRTAMILLLIAGVAWGMYGVAVAGSLGLVLNWLVLTLWAVPRAGLERAPLLRALWRPMSLFVVIFCLCRLLELVLTSTPLPSWAVLGALVLLGVLIVCAAVWFVPAYKRDAAVLMDTVRRVRGD